MTFEAIKNREDLPQNHETLGGRPIDVFQLRETAPERASFNKPDINIIHPEALRLRMNEVALGLGRPNAFTLFREPEYGQIQAFNAKSLRRAPSSVDETKGRIQSGIFIILKELSTEAAQAIIKAAKERQGSSHVTCVRANMEVLDDAGIKLGNGEPLKDIMMPDTLFKTIVSKGLSYRGEPIAIDFANSTKHNLESYLAEIKKTTNRTPIRHVQRWIRSKFPQKKVGDSTDITPVMSLQERCRVTDSPDHKDNFTFQVARISEGLGVWKRKLFGPQTFFRFEQDEVKISEYVDTVLPPYPDEEPSFSTRLKKWVFNPATRRFIGKHIQPGFEPSPGHTEADLINRFEIWTEQTPHKYNIVARLDDCIKITKVRNLPENQKTWLQKMFNWVLSKHVLLSEHEDADQAGVVFAGEVRRDEHNIVWVNRDSGTFKPEEKALIDFVRYLKELFPHIDIRAEQQSL